MDPATSKTCQTCNQQVYPRDIRSDGTCKSCARKQYYQSRKDLLAERYKNNREQRLLKQKEYYLRKRASQTANPTSTPASDRSRRKPKQQVQNDYEKEANGQPSSQTTVIIDPQASSSSNASLHAGLDLLNSPTTLVKIPYTFTTSASPSVTTQPMQFMLGAANGVQNLPYITWEMLNQPTGHQNGGRL